MSPEPSPGRSPGGALPDEAVVSRVRAGEVELFELLMRRDNQRAYRAARAVLGDAPEVDDVVQEAWLQAYLHLDGFEGRARFSTWLYRITRNVALSRARRPSWLVTVGDAPEPSVDGAPATADPERAALEHERMQALERAVDALPEGHRSGFMLRAVEGLSTAETAECLGVGEGVVKMRLHRARTDLRARLGRDAGEATPGLFGFAGERCDRMVARVMARLRAGGPPAWRARTSERGLERP